MCISDKGLKHYLILLNSICNQYFTQLLDVELMTKIKFYVNRQYDNQVTIDHPMDVELASFGCITWKYLIEEIMDDKLPKHEEECNDFLETYNITFEDLDCLLDEASVDKYYDQISYHVDNHIGSQAKAFDFIASLDIISRDMRGAGNIRGIHLERTTANGPKKFVYVDNEAAAKWLKVQCEAKGVVIDIEFV